MEYNPDNKHNSYSTLITFLEENMKKGNENMKIIDLINNNYNEKVNYF
jgi:hypothetical protein